MARVLVTDGDERSALAVVRSLGRAGHDVIVGAPQSHSLAGASRFAAARLQLPHPLTAPAEFGAAVAAAARAQGCEVVLPVTDASVLAVLSHPGIASVATVPLPSLEQFRAASDKALVAEAAAAAGLAVPRQVVVERRTTLPAAVATRAFAAPLVLKPSRSVAGVDSQRTRHGVQHAADWDTAARLAAGLPESAFPLLIQERIVGAGVGVFLLVWQGAVLAAFAHRRLREKPPSGGVSVLSESIALDPALLQRATALLTRFGWSGVAMVELKREEHSGRDVVMEINGRFWGSLQLALDAGVDFPRLLVDAALGRPVTPVLGYRVGVRSRWFWGDVDHLLARLLRSRRALALPPGAPGRLHTAAAFAGASVGLTRDQVFRLDDLRPFLRESVAWLRGVAGA